jgi:hypothetical protein
MGDYSARKGPRLKQCGQHPFPGTIWTLSFIALLKDAAIDAAIFPAHIHALLLSTIGAAMCHSHESIGHGINEKSVSTKAKHFESFFSLAHAL